MGLLGGGYLAKKRRPEPINRPILAPDTGIDLDALPPMPDDLPDWDDDHFGELVDTMVEAEAAKKASLRAARRKIGAKRLASRV
jgi:hypothetical protein